MSSLLIRGIALPDESLSSFRQRIWLQNGHSLFPVFSPEIRRSDPDTQRSTSAIDTLAERLSTHTNVIYGMTLWSHPLLANASANTKTLHPQWIIPLRYGKVQGGAGSMICPECIKESGMPHFRKAWRFSSNLACPVHQCKLVACCPQCGMPFWPYPAVRCSSLFTKILSLDECPTCHLNLGQIAVENEPNQNILDWAAATAKQSSLKNHGPQESLMGEQFSALRVLMGLALSHRSRIKAKLAKTEEFGSLSESLLDTDGRNLSFDRLEAKTRRSLMVGAIPLLQGWPHRFLSFSERAELSAVDFSEAWAQMPHWMQHLVVKELGQPGRHVSLSDVQDGIAKVIAGGGKPTMESVGRLVGSKYAKAIRKELGKRTVATLKERHRLVANLRRGMKAGPTRRMTSAMARARDVLAVLLSIATGKPVSDILNWSRAQILEVMEQGWLFPAGDAVVVLLREAFDAADALHDMRRDSSDNGPFLISVRKGTSSSRGPVTALREAMTKMDRRLERKTEVFYRVSVNQSGR